MRKQLLIFTLFAVSGTAQTAGNGSNKPEFKISIHAHQAEIPAGDPIELEITKTNISSHTLCVSRANGYTYNAWRSGTSVPETKEARSLHQRPGPMIDCNLPPHQWVIDTAAVSDYRDMSQPGTYTVQVSEGTVTSNTVTVTVTPRSVY
jgi:hypothetical protein